MGEHRNGERAQPRQRRGAVIEAEATPRPPAQQGKGRDQQRVGEAQQGQLAIGGPGPAVDGPLHPQHRGHRLVVERRVLGHLVELADRLGAPLVVPRWPMGLVGGFGERMEAHRGGGDLLARSWTGAGGRRERLAQPDDGDLVVEAVVVGVRVAIREVQHQREVRGLIGRLPEGGQHRPARGEGTEGDRGREHQPRHSTTARTPGRGRLGHGQRAYRWTPPGLDPATPRAAVDCRSDSVCQVP